MNRLSRLFGFLPIIFLLVSTVLIPGESPSDLDANSKSEELSFVADRMETILAQGRERTVLTGSAELTTDSTIIRADYIELLGADFELARCRGSVSVIDVEQGIELLSDELFFDRQQLLLRIQGAALLIDRRNEVVVKGGFLEYDQTSGEAIVQIGVRILKSNLASRSEFARYQREQNRIHLSGMPMVKWKGDQYTATRIFIDLNEDTILLDGMVKGTITVS